MEISNGASGGQHREDVEIGATVDIVLKEDQTLGQINPRRGAGYFNQFAVSSPRG